MAINLKKIEGQWVALDDKDRIISIGEDYNKVLEECCTFKNTKEQLGLNIYSLPTREIKKAIRYLLD